MTNQDLFNGLSRLDAERKRRISEAESKYASDRKALLDAYAKANARFRKGDVIMQLHPNYGPVGFTIIRVGSVETVREGSAVFLMYRGREIYPDFTEGCTVGGEPRYEAICDRRSDAALLSKPLYVSFIVVTSSGREIPANTYLESINEARSVLTSTDEDVVRYGVTESGERVEIQQLSNVNKYFRKH